MIEVQCSSCHTRYRIDEQVLPEGTPTFKCSRCGHVFSLEPRNEKAPTAERAPEIASAPTPPAAAPSELSESPAQSEIKPEIPAGPRANPPAAPTASPPRPSSATTPPDTVVAESAARTTKRKPSETGDGAENLAFDFHDEPSPAQPVISPSTTTPKSAPQTAASHWQVGDDNGAETDARPRPRFKIGAPEFEDATLDEEPESAPEESEFVDESAAPLYNRGIVHSSRFVVALFLVLAVGFALLTLAIHNAPAAALEALNHVPMLGARFPIPSAPARMVALEDVHGGFEPGRNGARDLVVRGRATNVSQAPLRSVMINVGLTGPMALQREIYCGNNLDARTLSQMTAHEVDFFQKLKPRDFELAPAASCPFVAVFADAPASARDFQLEVTAAVPATEADAMTGSDLGSGAGASAVKDDAP